MKLGHRSRAAAARAEGHVGHGQPQLSLADLVGHLHPRQHLGTGEGAQPPAGMSRVGADYF